MLPLPRLDDENFEDILLDARRQIPSLTNDWTDFNEHDPGITLLQLLAWLKEMQQFYLDGIGDAHRLKYLKLLNHAPLEAGSASVDLVMENVERDMHLPKGTPFDSQGITFELQDTFFLINNRIKCMQSRHKDHYSEITSALQGKDHVAQFIFAENPEAGDEWLIGFEQEVPENVSVNLAIHLAQPGNKIRNNISGDFFPLARLRWTFWDGDTWRDMHTLRDETYGLLQDGCIELTASVKMKSSVCGEYPEPLYWLRCELLSCDYDAAPKLAGLSIHSSRATQQRTLSEIIQYSGNGEVSQTFYLDTYLSIHGHVEAQVKMDNGLWQTWNAFEVREAGDSCRMMLVLKPEQNGMVPPSGVDNIRLVASDPSWQGQNIIGSSNGYPSQTFLIELEDLVEEGFELQIGVPSGEGMLWQDWKRVDDLLIEGPESQSYRIDLENTQVIFGDGRNGAIPHIGSGNIRVISCKQSKGSRGNIKDGIFRPVPDMEEYLSGVRIANYKYAEGGREAESIDDAILRFRKDFKKVTRAVTEQDYEKLVMETPGLMIDQVRAISNYRPVTSYQSERAANCMTVVVKSSFAPVRGKGLNKAYHENIRRHLERFRLITTEVNIISPRYVGINVTCIVDAMPYYKDIKNVLRRFFEKELDAIHGKRVFGQDVEYGDIYGKIESLDGIRRIISLSLEPSGMGVLKRSGGDIVIPPEGLTFVESLDIEVNE